MRLLLPFALCLPLFFACSPYTFDLRVDLREASLSGLTLAGKNVSVVSLDNGAQGDSLFLSGVAENFASQLEKDYFGGNRRIGLFRMLRTSTRGNISKAVMLDYLIETGSDVVFVFTLKSLGPVSYGDAVQSAPDGASGKVFSADSAYVIEAKVPFDLSLSVYDAMYQKDTVLVYNGVSEVSSRIYSSGSESREVLDEKVLASLRTAGENIGRQASRIFKSEWRTMDFTLYNLDTEAWSEASSAAYNFEWKKAMEGWISLLDTPDLQKRSCLEYNLAVVNAILGQKSLALEWLDRSDADYHLPTSSALRLRLNRMK